MDKIKVVHICDKFGVGGSTVHGVSRLFTWWMARFDRDRYDVKLYGVKTPDAASRALEETGISLDYMGHTRLSPGVLRSFMRVIRDERPDILHLHGWIAANFGRMAGKLTGVPTIMHEHGVDPKFPRSQRTADFLLRGCTHTVVAVSESVSRFLVEQRSVPPEKIRVIYNGAPVEQFRPAGQEMLDSVRSEFSIASTAPVVGTIGRLDTQKGNTYFIRAARQVLAAFPTTRFLVVGDGPRRSELEQEAADLGLAESVVFTGHRSDIPAIQTLLDVQVFPSLWEGTPLTVFEAMAMGKPIVSTDVDGLGEVLTHGRNALVVKPESPELLAEGIIRLLRDRELASGLGENAIAASRDYDIARTVKHLESLYEETYAAGRGR